MGRRRKEKTLWQEASHEALLDAARVMTAAASGARIPIELVAEFYSYCLRRQIPDLVQGRLSFGETKERAVRASLRLSELWAKHSDRLESTPGVYASLAATAFRQAYETPETLAKRGRHMLSARGGHARWNKMSPEERTELLGRATEARKRKAAQRREERLSHAVPVAQAPKGTVEEPAEGKCEAGTDTAQTVRRIGPAPKLGL